MERILLFLTIFISIIILNVTNEAICGEEDIKTLAIIGIPSSEMLMEDSEKIYNTLMREATRIQKFKILKRTVIDQVFEIGEFDFETSLKKAKGLLDEGKKLYHKLGFDKAIVSLLEANKIFLNNVGTKNEDLIEINLYLGMSYLGKGAEGEAKKYFENLIRINPEFIPDPNKIAPNIVQKIEKTKATLNGVPKGTLEVESKPDADIYINGKQYGRTPFKVDLLPGTHLIMLSQDGYKESLNLTEIKSNEVKQLQITLTAFMSGKKLTSILSELPNKSIHEKINFGIIMGELLKVPFVLIADIEVLGVKYFLTLYMIDISERKNIVTVDNTISLDLNDMVLKVIAMLNEVFNKTDEYLQRRANLEDNKNKDIGDTELLAPIELTKDKRSWYKKLFSF